MKNKELEQLKEVIQQYAVHNDKEHQQLDEEIKSLNSDLKEFQGMVIVELSNIRDSVKNLESPKLVIDKMGLKLTANQALVGFLMLVFAISHLNLDIMSILHKLIGG